MKRAIFVVKQWMTQHWKKVLIYGGAGVVGLLLIVQLAYPRDRLVPYAVIDGLTVGGWQRDDAVWELNKRYAEKKVAIYFGDNKTAYRSPTTRDIGTKVDNQSRVDNASYQWWLRLVPGSIFWARWAIDVTQPTYDRSTEILQRYIAKELGNSCRVDPINASLRADNTTLRVVPSVPGGTCEARDVEEQLLRVTPVLSEPASLRVPMQEVPPAVGDDAARRLADELLDRTQSGVTVTVADKAVVVPQGELIAWLDFVVRDGQLSPVLNEARSATFLAQQVRPLVTIAPGVSYITTLDFVITEQKNGQSGRALDVAATLESILRYVTNRSDEAMAVTRVVPPRIEYTRTYSPTNRGLSALLENFSKDNKGTYGISLIELSGQRRRASFDADKQFITASTYKLFVAYSALTRIEAGEFKWTDQVAGGRDLAKCFDDMIVQSDNPCAETLLQKIGFRAITDEARKLGLANTTFLKGDSPLTTAGDLATFLATLQSGQMLSASSRERLLDAMKRNVYRQGVPAGVSSDVADKVGFLDGLLHDASVVYSPHGTYVLTVMTDGSSWAAIADLAKQIESLRSS